MPRSNVNNRIGFFLRCRGSSNGNNPSRQRKFRGLIFSQPFKSAVRSGCPLKLLASRSHSSCSHPFIVRLFLDLLNAPHRKLWHTVMIYRECSHFVLCTSPFFSNLSLRLEPSMQSYNSARASCPSVSISHSDLYFLQPYL